MEFSKGRVVFFSIQVCLACSILVAVAAVQLKDRQVANAALDRQKKVLVVAGLLGEDGRAVGGEEGAAPLNADGIRALFAERIVPQVIDLASGEEASGVDAATFDQQRAAKDPAQSRETTGDRANRAQVRRVPNQALVYQVRGEGDTMSSLILPIEGKGLWSTLYGFLAVSTTDHNTIQGITFYQHGETPGLGGEVDNPSWKALWRGRKIADESGAVQIQVIKGIAGRANAAPYEVDGLSGATITSNGVTSLLHFWLADEQGFAQYLSRLRRG